ncbi:hypothetical protein [Pseudomonas sp. UBA1879]|uniref:hypothetical protein n=1 Tax=Pseudomonas sp. UBA1879 TaxID=1947305 RepID=UPI0025E21673|nr:hypothetical protein [Pseudomonas sp. UBA1879]
MYASHSQFNTPPDDTVIWRYMSVEKYLSLLHTKSLFMCRLDRFEDPWEGAYSVGYESSNPETREVQAIRRGFLFVNCWHANEHESAAMWDLYATRHAGVAIKTTIGSLKNSIIAPGEIFIGAVRYEDYSVYIPNLAGNVLFPALVKRRSFSHEHEIRLLALNYENSKWHSTDSEYPYYGYSVPGTLSMVCEVDLNLLLKDVMFSPSMPDWLFETLKDVSGRFNIWPNHTKSSLYDRQVV